MKLKKANELKKIEYQGKKYYVDFRLKEFRTIEPPLEFISFRSAKGEAIIDECIYKIYHRKIPHDPWNVI